MMRASLSEDSAPLAMRTRLAREGSVWKFFGNSSTPAKPIDFEAGATAAPTVPARPRRKQSRSSISGRSESYSHSGSNETESEATKPKTDGRPAKYPSMPTGPPPVDGCASRRAFLSPRPLQPPPQFVANFVQVANSPLFDKPGLTDALRRHID